MKKIIDRLILFFIGLPIILSSVYFFPYAHFLLLHCLMVAVTAISVIEIYPMLKTQLAVYPLPLMLVISLIMPVAAYLNTFALFAQADFLFTMAFACFVLLSIEVGYSFVLPLTKSIQRMAAAVLIFIYPGVLLSFVSPITRWPYASHIITVFLFIVFICDSAAWLFGTLFGKNNRGFVPASPNKSIAGFIGGVLSSLAAGILAYYLFPHSFGTSLSGSILVGLLTALAAIIGDLVESVIKRSAQVKDSGAIILGRGGIMDSIDSIITAAPVFYVCYRLNFGTLV